MKTDDEKKTIIQTGVMELAPGTDFIMTLYISAPCVGVSIINNEKPMTLTDQLECY